MNPILHAFMPTLSPVLRNVLIFFVSVALLWGASVVHANLGSAPVSPPPVSGMKTSRDPQQTAQIRARYGKLPLQFEANQGQAQSQAKFIARGHGYQLALLPGKALLRLRQTATPSQPAAQETDFGIHFIGANNDAVMQGQDSLPGKSNYFVGNDPAQWRANVPTFAKVQYQALYPGVDLLYYGQQGQLEYDFIVAPGADARRIQMVFDGVQSVRIAKNGELVLRTATGVVRQLKPVIYQTIDGKRRTVPGRYVLQGKQRVGFQLGKYDRSQPLVIDPILEYSTFIGGTSSEQGLGIVVDKDGNAYITGDTFSSDFPVAGAIQPTKNNLTDVFVLKLNASGSAIVYATYLGGISSDTGNGIAIDAEGNAYVTGLTVSTDFPVTNGALQPTSKGLTDAFIVKLNLAGSALVYSSYLGGSGRDIATAIAIDSTGSAYITGRTDSTDLLTTGLQTNRSGNLAYKTANRGDAWTASANGVIGFMTNAIGVNPAFPNIIFLSTTSGTYRSINEGVAWQPLTLPPPITNGFPLVLSIAFNPKNPSTVYFGGFGVFKSTDDGMTWATKNTGLNVNGVPPLVNAIAVDPKQPDTVYAGTNSGLYKSTDGGENWTAMNFGLNYQPQTAAQLRITELVIDPNNTATVYAGTALGVFKTTDGASNWMAFSGGLPIAGQFPIEIASLALEATNPSILYASTLGGQGGVYKSLNGGLSWAVSSSGLSPSGIPGVAPVPVSVIATDPLNAGTVYAGTNSAGVFKSTDAGANWSRVISGLTNNNISALAIDSATPAKIYAGTNVGNDGFVAKLNPAGTQLNYLSYLGGSEDEDLRGIAVDKDKNAYVTGYSASANYPTVNPYQATFGGFRDVVVSKINPAGSALVYSTFLGGTSDEQGRGIVVNAAGEAYLTGLTFSPNFPTANAIKNTGSGFSDVFITKLSSDGTKLEFSTYLGGQVTDQGYGIALDPIGNVYVAGISNSFNFPVVNAFQSQLNGPSAGLSNDAFVTKLDGAGTKILYSTFLGGRQSEQANAIAVDAAGNAYLTGQTSSSDFPTVNPLLPYRTLDVFIAKLSFAADLSLTMTDSRDPVMVGNEFTYNLTVTNNGPDAASNVVVTDTLPANVTVGSTVASQGTCTGTGPITCNLGTLEQNAKVTITLTLTPNAVGTITNQANLTGSLFDQKTDNNAVSQSTRISDKPSIVGRVTLANGEGIGRVAMTLTGNPATTTTNADGTYQFLELPVGSNLTITPTRKGYVFNPVRQTLSNLNRDQIVNFTGVLCDFTITPGNRIFPNVGGTGSIQITSPDAQCPWTARSNDAWVKLTSPTTGMHNSTVTFTVAPTAAARSGTITVAGKTFTVSQEAGACNGGVEFNLPSARGVTLAATQFVSRDFNADGFADVALITATPNPTIAVALNDGKGNFNQPVVVLNGAQPKSITSGDINADGKMDLVFVNASTDNNVSILLGNGAGGFAAPLTFKAGTNPNWASLGDFNGDKKLDLFIGNSSTNGGAAEYIAALYLGNGDGTFAAGRGLGDPIPFFDPVAQLEVGDFNGDGKLDALMVMNSSGVRVLIGDGMGGFVSSMGGAPIGGVSAVVADFNRDGKSDYAYLFSGRAFVLLGAATSAAAVYDFPGAIKFATGDLNTDGKPDLIGVTEDSVLLRYGNGDGTFGDIVPYGTNLKNSTVNVLDADGDGRLDLLLAGTFGGTQNSNLGWAILRGTKEGGLNAPRQYFPLPVNNNSSGDGVQHLFAGDFNRDGIEDLLSVTGGGRFAALLGNGLGGFRTTEPGGGGVYAQAVQVRDFNRDGNPDIGILNGNNNRLTMHLGDGKGAFPNIWIAALNTPANTFEVADFNQDGNTDLLVKTSANNLAILTGDGNGIFTEAITGLAPPRVGLSTFVFALGDYNGDGENDIAVVHTNFFVSCSSETQLLVLPGEGNGNFGNPIITNLPTRPERLYPSDINDDGRTDLVFTETCTSNRNSAYVLFANANGSFDTPRDFSVGIEPTAIAIGDVTGDGRKDIITSNSKSGNVTILRGSVGNSFLIPLFFGTFQTPGPVAIGDFNGDGKADLGIANTNTTTVAAWLNRFTCFVPNKVITTSAAHYIGTRLTAEGIASSFGDGLATRTQAATDVPLPTELAGTTVKIKDAQGMEFTAPLFFVSAQQVNWQVPKGVAIGVATVTITSGSGAISTGTVEIVKLLPGIFAASSDGVGILAASVVRVTPSGQFSYEQTFTYSEAQKKNVARELVLGADELFLEMYGTGMRGHSGLANVTARIGGVAAEVSYAGAQCCLVGIDQINVKIPKALAGRGEVEVVLTVDGRETNPLRINIK